MKEIISSILEAEAKAEQIVNQAEVDAKALNAKANEEAQKIILGAQETFRAKRAISIKNAEKKGQEKYQAIIDQANQQKEELGEGVEGKIISVAGEILGEIIK